MLPELAELSGSCGVLPVRVQTLAVGAPSLSPGIVSSPKLCADVCPLLEITTVKCFTPWVCCPTSGSSDRGDSYVSDGGRRLAHHPENAVWSTEENGVWLMHPQCKKWTVIFLCSSIFDFAIGIDHSALNSADLLPASSGKHRCFIYKEFLESLLHTHINNYLLGWFWFNRILKGIWRKFLL